MQGITTEAPLLGGCPMSGGIIDAAFLRLLTPSQAFFRRREKAKILERSGRFLFMAHFPRFLILISPFLVSFFNARSAIRRPFPLRQLVFPFHSTEYSYASSNLLAHGFSYDIFEFVLFLQIHFSPYTFLNFFAEIQW